MEVQVSNHLHLEEFVKKHLQEPYFPPRLLHYTPYTSYLQLFLKEGMTYPSMEDLKQEHHVFPLSDGQCCTTVFYPQNFHPTTPMVFLFPTLTADNHYFSALILKLTQEYHWGAILINKRGQHCPLLNCRIDPIGNDHDTHVMIQWACEKFKTHTFYALGVSAGAIMLSRYLGKFHPEIKAAVAISGPFDTQAVESLPPLVQSQMKRRIYDKYTLPPATTPEEEAIHKKMEKWVNDTSNITDLFKIFRERSTPQIVEREVGLKSALPHIKIPMLFINAKDDPLFPAQPPPLTTMEAIFVSSDAGSHACYFQSAWSLATLSWAEEKALQFFRHLHYD